MLTTFNVERYKDPTTITLLKISRQKWKSSHRQWKLFGTWFFSFSTRLHSKSNTLYSLKITEHILKASLDGKCFIIVYDVCIRILKSLQNWVRFYCLKFSIAFSGADCISWLQSNFKFCHEREAIHFAGLLCCHGYLFPIDDHIMTVRNDNNTLYRYTQTFYIEYRYRAWDEGPRDITITEKAFSLVESAQ